MIQRLMLAPMLLLVTCLVASAQDYRVEVIDGPPESDDVSEELLKQFADTGIRVIRGTSRTAAEIWFCKQWQLDPEFVATDEMLYPFAPGQLIGLLHFSRRGSDFRDQQISSGWYTLRFGLQPIDGNHEGTSPTRDFLLMVAAESDEAGKEWDVDELNEISAEAAGSTHPAMLCLQRASDGKKLEMRHQEETDWWIVHTVGKGVAGSQSKDVPVDIVVAGHAEE